MQLARCVQPGDPVGELASGRASEPTGGRRGLYAGGLRGRRPFLVANMLEEAYALEQLHDEEPILPVGDQLVEGDEIGVGDAQEGAKLVLEAQDRRGAGAVHDLEGDRAAALAVIMRGKRCPFRRCRVRAWMS